MGKDERIDQLLSREWQALTESEKSFVISELGSEDMFQNMKQVNSRLAGAHTDIVPRAETIKHLKTSFQRHHRSVSWIEKIAQVQLPAYASVLAIFIAVFVGWLWGGSEPGRVITQTIVQVDTLYVASKPDTIFLTKVVYKQIPKKEVVIVSLPAEEVETVTGVTMQDKEELNTIIVSGTE